MRPLLSLTDTSVTISICEVLAMVLATQLEGSSQPFLVWTDHKNLCSSAWLEALFLGLFRFTLSIWPGSHKPDAPSSLSSSSYKPGQNVWLSSKDLPLQVESKKGNWCSQWLLLLFAMSTSSSHFSIFRIFEQTMFQVVSLRIFSAFFLQNISCVRLFKLLLFDLFMINYCKISQ